MTSIRSAAASPVPSPGGRARGTAAAWPRTCAATALLALLPSCFTATLWGGGFEPDTCSGEYELRLTGGERLTDDVVLLVLATPFALALDVLTACPQAVLMGWRHGRCR